MRNSNRSLHPIFLAGLFALPVSAETPDFRSVQEQIERYVAEGRTPSIAVAVIQNGNIVWAKGFGLANVEEKTPATPDTIYRLASISKPITATGLMLLVDQGKIGLDDPANKHLGEVKLRAYRGDAGEITLRRLASHTAGLPIHYNFYYNGLPPLSMEETIRRYGFAVRQPGSDWDYSNLGFGILDHVTERASATPWRRFMVEKLYDPLGLSATDAGVRPGKEKQAARQYTRDVAGRFVAVAHYEFDHPGGSVICSSANDMARFAQFHLAGGSLRDVRLLKEDSVREMQRAVGHRPDGSAYGLGWFLTKVRGQTCVSHSGGMPGVSTLLRLYPDSRSGSIVLTNCDPQPIAQSVSDRISELLFAQETHVNQERPRVSSVDRMHFAGQWTGKLVHFEGDIPVKLNVGPSDASIRFGRSGENPLRSIDIAGGSTLVTRTGGKLKTQDGFHGPVDLEFRLYRDGEQLVGHAVALAPEYFALSHWVELKREGKAVPAAAANEPAKSFDVLIRGGKIVDGTGSPWYVADIGIRKGTIAAIGKLDGSAEHVIDAAGLIVAPGFVDMMGQTAAPFLRDSNAGFNLLTQGITTINAGEGQSDAPLSEPAAKLAGWKTMAGFFAKLEATGLPINVAQTVGHTQIRRVVIGEMDRKPTSEEMERMKEHVREAMRAGAIGVSTALIYPPAVYASTDEIAELAKVAGEMGGKYFTHMRNEGDRLLEAIDEALDIGGKAGTPVHIFHLKTAGRQNWSKMPQAIARIQAARASGKQVAADVYPYVNNGLGIEAFVHPRHAADGPEALKRRLQDPKLRAEIRADMEDRGGWENWYRHVGNDWNKVVLSGMPEPYTKYNGQSLGQIARSLEQDPWMVFFDIAVKGAFAMPESMSEANKILALKQPFMSFDTDVGPAAGSRIATHPRAFGAFPRVLARYVRELGALSLEQAISQMTSVGANELFAYDRGRIAEGLAADIVIFDFDRITDRATFAKPTLPSEGVEYVLVNGRLALDRGKYTGSRAGRILRGPGYRPSPL